MAAPSSSGPIMPSPGGKGFKRDRDAAMPYAGAIYRPIKLVPSTSSPLKEDSPAVQPAAMRSEYVEKLIKDKHLEYNRKAGRYACLYYFTRLTAGLSAGVLPFVVRSFPDVAMMLSVTVVIAIVFDFVFNPKDRWALFSQASNLLALAELKARGEYDDYKDLLDIITRTEGSKLSRLTDINDLVKTIEQTGTSHSTS